MGNNRFKLIFALIFFVCLLSAIKISLAAEPYSAPANSSDAIAVRIIPNPNHYSIARWYESQGFQGSPQSLLVDGYEAIRDGRTVYVNAANIDQATRTIYTNIYLISYNQDSAPNTVDILGQIIAHWKFNNNLVESSPATCSVSALNCAADTDCPQGSACLLSGGSNAYSISGSNAYNFCLLKQPKNCLVDADCPTDYFCNSLKARVTRDLKRVGRLEEMKEALANFKKTNQYYPRLAAGSYLAGNSISTWPSWSQELLSNLALPQSFVDPVNRLGACPGYDQKTCWSVAAKKFFNNQSNFGAVQLNLPPDSYAFAYATDATGSKYSLCAVLESRMPSLAYRFSPNDPADSACAILGIGGDGQAANTAPQLVNQFLVGEVGREFNGYIQVKDNENNPLIWTLDTTGTDWASWSAAPTLKDTSSFGQKKVSAARAGAKGDYSLNLGVNDGKLTVSIPLSIKILSSMINIEADDAAYIANPIDRFSYSFSFSGRGVSASSYSLIPDPANPFDLLADLGPSARTVSLIGPDRYRISYSGFIPKSRTISQDLDFKYNLRVTDSLGNSANKGFAIQVKAEKPLLDFNCSDAARVGIFYSCTLGALQQGNHNLKYSATNLPAGFKLSAGTSQFLQGSSAYATASRATITATNEYGAAVSRDFALKVNTYCGDGVKQTPNTEGRGGLYNDGYEDCDIQDSVASGISFSADSQYGCQTTDSSARPFPILTNDQCVFKSPTQGGGYCGDGYCQAKINNAVRETCDNCAADCCQAQAVNNNCTPQCAGKSCGDDGCGGSCGLCASSQTCINGHCIGAQCSASTQCNDNNPCTDETCSGGVCSYSHSHNSFKTDCTYGTYYDYFALSGGTVVATSSDHNSRCFIKGTKSCSQGVFGDCITQDPRAGYCTDYDKRCEGETYNATKLGINLASVCNGTCVNTGNDDFCLDGGGNRIDSKPCSVLFNNNRFSGNAPCDKDCTGYTTSTAYCICTPDTCASTGRVCGSGYPNGCAGAPNAGTLYCGATSSTASCNYGTCYGTKTRTCSASGTWNAWGACSVQAPTCASLKYVCGSKNSDGCGGLINCGADSRTSRLCTVSGSNGYKGYYLDTCVKGAWVNGINCLPLKVK